MNINEFLEKSTDIYPEKAAVKFEDSIFTYSRLNDLSNNLAFNLSSMGITYGKTILITTGNRPETIIALFATSKISALFVPVNPLLKKDKILSIIYSCEPSCIICDATLVNEIANFNLKNQCIIISTEKTGNPKIHLFSDLTRSKSGNLPIGCRPIGVDIASIIYTSGSTGEPKGVTLTHSNIDAASRSIISFLGNVPNDIILNALPLSFDYGLYQVLMSIRFGGTLILEKSFTYFNRILERISSERVTGFPLVPTMAEILLKMGDLERYDLSSLRYFTNTAQSLNQGTVKKLRALFPDVKIFSMYGLTECKRVSYLDPNKIDRKPLSVGRAIPDTEVFLLNNSGERIDEHGVIGELAVRGSHIMLGYWNDPESTNKIIIPGRFPGDRVLLTGDLFKFDEDGDLYFVGRKDDMIKIGGEKANPREVEGIVGSMDGVDGCVAIAIPDEILGNKFICLIIGNGKITENEVKRFCSDRLEKYLVPQKVVFVNKLPLTNNGKIDKMAIINNLASYLTE